MAQLWYIKQYHIEAEFKELAVTRVKDRQGIAAVTKDLGLIERSKGD